jgi:hypothetical protein
MHSTQDKALIYLAGAIGITAGPDVARYLADAEQASAAKGDIDLANLLAKMAEMAKHGADLRDTPQAEQ